VTATSGALVGPPWQRRENGRRAPRCQAATPLDRYSKAVARPPLRMETRSQSRGPADAADALRLTYSLPPPSAALLGAGTCSAPCRRAAAPSLYLEPHVEFDEDELRAFAPVDAVITPTRGQALPGFELVHGPAAAVRLVETLRPRLVLPMSNGAIDAAGIAAPLVTPIGAGNEFERLLAEAGVGAEVLEVRPGEPLTIG